MTTPVFTAVDHGVLRNFRGVYPDGAEAIVAGPSTTLGKSRVARLDLTSPAAPVVVRSDEIAAPFGFFAWDGETTSIVAAAGVGATPVHEGYVVHEEGGAFTSAGIPLPQHFGTANPIAAHADRLFALSDFGFGMYRIRR